MPTAVLLVAFGTLTSAGLRGYRTVEQRVRERYPEPTIRWAYTGKRIRRKLTEQGGEVSSPEAALFKLAEDGFDRAAVLSLQVVPGEEFHDLVSICSALAGVPKGLKRIDLARPLIGSPTDLADLAVALTESVVPREGERVVLVGHGGRHPANLIYPALAYLLQRENKGLLVGALESQPGLDEIIADLKAAKVERVRLCPLLAAAGRHYEKDIADHWGQTLVEAGFTVELEAIALTERPPVVDMWLNRLAAIMDQDDC